MKLESTRRRLQRRATRFLAGAGIALAVAALGGNWTGFGWISGPAAIGALGALLLAFAVAQWSAATGGPQTGDAYRE